LIIYLKNSNSGPNTTGEIFDTFSFSETTACSIYRERLIFNHQENPVVFSQCKSVLVANESLVPEPGTLAGSVVSMGFYGAETFKRLSNSYADWLSNNRSLS